MDDNEKPKAMGEVIQVDEARIRDHLGEMVRGTVEEALNAMLDAEADRLCGADRHEHSEGRKDTRAGSYQRSLATKAGKVSLKVPKLRRQTFETAIIERYRRRESSVEEALIERYLADVSVRRVEDITEASWGTRVSPGTFRTSTVSRRTPPVRESRRTIYAKIDAWRHRRIEGDPPYVYLDGIVMNRAWAGEVRNVSLLVAIGVTTEGYREILGIMEGPKKDKSGWSSLLRHLMDRGLSGVQLVVSDARRGLVESVTEYLPDTRWPRCTVHFHRNVFSLVPSGKAREVARMPKAIHAQEDRKAAAGKMAAVIAELRRQRLARAADLPEESGHETLTCYAFPDSHWIKLRIDNPLERIMREIRRRTRVVGAFPDGRSCLNLAAARLRHIAGTQWATRKYVNMTPLFADQTQGAVVA